MDESLSSVRNWLGSGSINIFGRPFAGKDTQGNKLVQSFGGALLGGGDILRNSKIPLHVSDALKRGELIPSDDYVSIVLPYLTAPEFKDRPLILSSVGRWVGEEQGVMSALETSNHPLRAVIYLDLDEEIVIERWKTLATHDDRGGRHDDVLEVLHKRLKEYREKTLPVLDVYDKLGLLIHIDGAAKPDAVFTTITAKLSERANRSSE